MLRIGSYRRTAGRNGDGDRLRGRPKPGGYVMTSHVLDAEHHRSVSPHAAHDATRFLVPLGRLLFVAIFLLSAPNHFSKGVLGYAAGAGVPFPELLVPLSGILALVGGLSVLL